MQIKFEATIIEWRGPSPFYYAPVPEQHVEDLRRAAKIASYGWGVVPVEAKIGAAKFTTSLFPKDGGYLLPIKARVRQQAKVTIGDKISVTMSVQSRNNPFER